jgi:hypothetical protein
MEHKNGKHMKMENTQNQDEEKEEEEETGRIGKE